MGEASNRPAITIITATWNSEKTLADCLSSVKEQAAGLGTSGQIEHLLIDGNSSDQTVAIAESHSWPGLRIHSEPDDGIYDAMNKGIRLARGEVVGILNADDFYACDEILTLVLDRFKDPEVDCCYGDLSYVDEHETTRVVRHWKSGSFKPRSFYWGWMPPHPTFFVRRSLYEKHGAFNLDLGTAADYEIMLRFLLKLGASASYIPRVLVHMRTGGVSNASLGNRLAANRNDRRAWDVNSLRPYPWTLLAKPLRKIGQWLVPGH